MKCRQLVPGIFTEGRRTHGRPYGIVLVVTWFAGFQLENPVEILAVRIVRNDDIRVDTILNFLVAR